MSDRGAQLLEHPHRRWQAGRAWPGATHAQGRRVRSLRVGGDSPGAVQAGCLSGFRGNWMKNRPLARIHWSLFAMNLVVLARGCHAANVDLSGDGGGDQGGAAFLQEVDGALGFGDERVEFK